MKKVVLLLAAGLVIFFIIDSPGEAGNTLQAIISLLFDGFRAIITFFRSLAT